MDAKTAGMLLAVQAAVPGDILKKIGEYEILQSMLLEEAVDIDTDIKTCASAAQLLKLHTESRRLDAQLTVIRDVIYNLKDTAKEHFVV